MATPVQRNWEQEYERLLKEGGRGERVHAVPGHAEQRRHPRFSVDGGRILITEQVPYPIVDLSLSGLAFHSEKVFPVGQRIQVSLRSVIAIEALVLGCDPLTSDGAPAPYRIRCEFADPEYGLRFLMLALELEGGMPEPELEPAAHPHPAAP